MYFWAILPISYFWCELTYIRPYKWRIIHSFHCKEKSVCAHCFRFCRICVHAFFCKKNFMLGSKDFFLVIGKKKYIQKTARCKKALAKFFLISKKKRNKVTRSESPSPSPIKKGTSEESKQLVFRSIQILKRPPIAFPPNAPHQTHRN